MLPIYTQDFEWILVSACAVFVFTIYRPTLQWLEIFIGNFIYLI